MTKVNLIALIVFLGLLVWVFTFDHAVTRKVQSAALSYFAPFQKSGNSLREKAGEATVLPESVESLRAENSELRRQNAALQIERQEAERLLEENNTFRQMLGFEQAQKWKLIPAKVIGRSVSTWWNTVVIDRGDRHGVALDSPVVSDQGLVGKTVLLSPTESTVVLLTDERCQLAARIEGTQERGIIMGTRGATKQIPDLRLRYLSKDAVPEIGARVTSSNDGGLFPAGFALGEVKSFEVLDLYGEAIVKPAVDFSRLQFVFVIEREEPELIGAPGLDPELRVPGASPTGTGIVAPPSGAVPKARPVGSGASAAGEPVDPGAGVGEEGERGL